MFINGNSFHKIKELRIYVIVEVDIGLQQNRLIEAVPGQQDYSPSGFRPKYNFILQYNP